MFASTLLSAATALFVFAPAAFGAPLATRDVSVSKITEIQSTISEANTHLSSLVTKFSKFQRAYLDLLELTMSLRRDHHHH